ncbi:carboxypeptidase-like regulatory domain-containing protein [Cryomorphaceae bacterium 1068]|nr:carboxypeptidase-like regulatory domain-containing protein [Cryomorphaceae bacterium 1068]
MSDEKTKKPIPFASIWIQGTQIGTTSAADGSFQIDTGEDDSLVFSAVGYKRSVLAVNDISDTVRLTSSVIELSEVTISPSADRFLKLGEVNRKDIEIHWRPSVSWSVGRYFEYNGEIAETPYIKDLSIVTTSKLKESTVKILLYELDEDGNPTGLIHDENIIATVKKGKRKQTLVDLSELFLRFPKNGLLVAVEAINLESNIYHFTKKICNKETGKCKKQEFQSLQPKWGGLPRSYNSYAWIYRDEKWSKLGDHLDEFTEEGKRYGGALAVDLTLSD